MAAAKSANGEEPTSRTAWINEVEKNPFGDNVISTSKYTLVSFIPISLFEQFRRIANMYFLFIIVLMLIGLYLPKIFVTPLSPYTTLGPLCIILAVVSSKDGAEDWKRHKSDDEVNNRKVPVLGAGGSSTETLWRNLRVGQVVRVHNREEVPADLILLQTSEPKSVCYVETSNIDGETNLKLKEALGPTATACPLPDSASHALRGELEYDPPNDRIHSFTGKMKLEGQDVFPVGARNMVLRGCSLRNTKWIDGIVVYTGKETKVMKKAGGARSKMSQVEKTMNTLIKIVFFAQVVLCSITTIACAVWNVAKSSQYSYLLSVQPAEVEATLWYPVNLGNWFTFLLLFNNFIPISLYVTVELVNFAQSSLVGTDMGMWDEESDTPARARTSTLNQDLGQIEYIFSDKTGTLTRNVMEFKQCAMLGGGTYGAFTSEADEDESKRLAAGKPADVESVSGVNPAFARGKNTTGAIVLGLDGKVLELPPAGTLSGFDDAALYALLRSGPIAPRWGEALTASGIAPAPAGVPAGPWTLGGKTFTWGDLTILEAFWTCMAVCHTVVPEADEKNANAPPVYQAESPDEAALTKAARDVGFEFLSRQVDSMIMRRTTGAGSINLKFGILGVHEFNSTRKRMSVVVRGPDGRAMLLVKGADNVIFDRAVVTPKQKVELDASLTSFAEKGLRTLLLAQRWMTEEEVATWKAGYNAAAVAMTGREDKLADLAEAFEVGLTVLGATAVEDKLQEGVPSTIRDLRRAGIKTWVLTGDKIETAINIGFSCRLLDPTMDIIQLSTEDPAELRVQLLALERKFKPLLDDSVGFFDRFLRSVAKEGKKKRKLGRTVSGRVIASAAAPSDRALDAAPGAPTHSADGFKGYTNMAVVVTGPALSNVLGIEELERAFLTVAQVCKSVVACRVSPQQKANIVQLVRSNLTPKPMTLAIGDGANDVGMIQRAEVGVGISGKEGLQAANAADFSIAQFRFLRRLLLVHGRWDYRRMCKVVLYSFYKNVVITLSLFYFNALTGFSGTSFYESLVYSSFNFVLGLPIIFVGICDRDVSEKTVLAHPSVYASGLYNLDLNVPLMLKWIGAAIVHSLILFWLPYGVYMGIDAAFSRNGMVDGFEMASWTTFSALVWGMQLSVSLQTLSWTRLNIIMMLISMIGWYVIFLIYSNLRSFSPQFYGVALLALTRPAYYLTILFTLGAQLLWDLSLESIRTSFFPDSVDIARELDAGFGAADKAVWGDEESEGERMAAAEGLVAAAATDPARLGITSESLTLDPKELRAAAAASGRPVGAVPGFNAVTSTSSDADPAAPVVAINAMRVAGLAAQPLPPAPPAAAAPKAAPPPPPTPSAAVAQLEHSVYVPKEAVLGDVDEASRKGLGISSGAETASRGARNFSALSKDDKEDERNVPADDTNRAPTGHASP